MEIQEEQQNYVHKAKLIAKHREKLGSIASSKIRKTGMIPAVIYGRSKDPLHIILEEKEVTKLYKQPQYISRVIDIDLDGEIYKVTPQDLDFHYLTDIITHADFYLISGEKHKMRLPLVYKNQFTCKGVKAGGYLNIIKRFILVEADSNDLPQKFEIDMQNIAANVVLRISDLKLPDNVKPLEDLNATIASVIGKKGKAEETENQ